MIVKNNSIIKELAESIASFYDNKITPLDEIVKYEELSVYCDSYEINTFDGMTIYDNGEFYIHLNIDKGNKLDSERGRFTLAHELGHYYIDSHRIGLKKGLLNPHASFTNKSQHHIIEREADYFASCLLMPEAKFKKDVERKKFGIDVIDFLKNEYKVSRTACALRFADVGNHPIMVIYAEDNKIKWKYCSDDFPYKYLLYDRNVPKNTVMGEYFNNKNIEDAYKTEQIWAIDCFNYVRDEDTNRKFYECCITYQNKALSIIWED